MILCQLELVILSKLDCNGGHFKKWPKRVLRPNFFLVTSLIISLKKSSESSGGGGCTVTNSSPWTNAQIHLENVFRLFQALICSIRHVSSHFTYLKVL